MVGNAVVPFRIRVGITGHRKLSDEEAIAAKVREVLEEIESLISATARTTIGLTVISPLAEGADRIGARVASRFPGARLETPLPFPPSRYCEDFATDASKEEFGELLRTAEPAPTRKPVDGEAHSDGYQAVGRYVADRSDVLIAVWDGAAKRGRGGTAEVVARAVRNKVPVWWIKSQSPHDRCIYFGPTPDEPTSGCRTRPAPEPLQASAELRDCVSRLERELNMVDEYNCAVPTSTLDLSAPTDTGKTRRPDTTWANDARRTAAGLAEKYQRRYRASLRATLLLAALAIVAIAAQTIFDLDPLVGLVELVSVLGVGLVVWLSHRESHQQRYLGYRFLAERLREAPFLALAGVDQVQPTAFAPEFAGYPSEGWPWRVFEEIWCRRPKWQLEQVDVGIVSQQLAEDWISAQRRHHENTHHEEGAKQDLAGRWVIGLFVATAVAALAHLLLEILGDWGESRWTAPNVMVFLSISLAAIGAALAGFASQRGYRRYSIRAREMIVFLTHDEECMRAANSPTVVRRVAEDTHRHMLAENRIWFRDLLFEEIELHT